MEHINFEEDVFTKTTINDFIIINNGIDDDIQIIEHIPSGFFNITKIGNSINDKKSKNSRTNEPGQICPGSTININSRTNESGQIWPDSDTNINSRKVEPAGIPAGSYKQPRVWFRSKTTKKLFETCQRNLNYPCIKYELKANTPMDMRGTYVHKYLYDHFVMWLDSEYAFKISQMIDTHRKKINDELRNDNNKLRSDNNEMQKIINEMRKEQQIYHKESMGVLLETKQEATIAKQEATVAKQEATIAKEESIKTNKTLEHVVSSMDTMHEDFIETAYHSTAIVPDGKKTYLALTAIVDNKNGTTSFKLHRAQKQRIFRDLINSLVKDKYRQLVIPPIYVAGAVNIPIAAMTKLKLKLRSIADKHNSGITCRKDKLSMTKLIISLKKLGLTLKFTDPTWAPNEYITRDDIVNTYLDIIKDSQERAFNLLDMPDDFKKIIEDRKNKYDESIANASDDAKEHLVALAQTICNASITINLDIN